MSVLLRIGRLSFFVAIALGGAALCAGEPVVTLKQVETLVQDGKYAEAETAARELLGTVEAQHGAGAPEVAAVLDALLEARWRNGQADDETLAIGRRSLEIKRRALGAEHAGVGETLHHLAIVAYFRNEYDDARARWARAIEIRTGALGADHPDVAESLNGQANLVWVMGDLAAAEQLFRRALAIRERAYGPDDPRVSMVRGNLSTLLAQSGYYAEALTLGHRCAELDERTLGAEHPEFASTLANLATVYNKTGDRATARAMQERVLAIWEKSLGPDHYLVGLALNNLAEQLRHSGRPAEARPMYEKVLAIWEKAMGPESELVGMGLANLALAADAVGNRDEAIVFAERSAAVREKTLGSDHPELANSLYHLGVLRMGAGDLTAARTALERALEIRAESLGRTHPDVAEAQIGLAALDARTERRGEALDLALASERIARDHLRLTGRALAEEHALRYAASRNRGLDLALTLTADGSDGNAVRRVLDEVVRSRAVVLDEMAARNRSLSGSADPEVARLAEEFASRRSHLANLTVRGLGDLDLETYRTILEQARKERDTAERAFAAASAEFAQEQRRAGLGLDDVADKLTRGAALVSFVLYENADLRAPEPQGDDGEPTTAAIPAAPVSSYVAIVFRADRPAPAAIRLGSAGDVDRLVGEWKQEAARGASGIRNDRATSLANYREAGDALRQRIWDPLIPHLKGVDRVFVIPDGSLNLVSLAALPVGGDRYLIERGPLVHYLSAERDLVPDERAVTGGTGLLAVGGPDYAASASFAAPGRPGGGGSIVASAEKGRTRSADCGDLRTLLFDPLPAAKQETEEVVAIWSESAGSSDTPDAQVVHLSGKAASEGAFKKHASGRRVLHIATHGFFLGGDCVAAPTRSRTFSIVKKSEPEALGVQLSPLLMSGLALAGANQRFDAGDDEEDGVLMAEEFAGLDLSGVEWAVLSACDTGVGEILAGEGVFGLRRAAEVAGVRTLIMSLWPVDDEATRAWMTALYRGRLVERLDSAEAVRNAGLSVLRVRRKAGESTHPFYWAAFVGAGDWR